MLLEGLNRNRPKSAVAVGVDADPGVDEHRGRGSGNGATVDALAQQTNRLAVGDAGG